MKPLRLQSLPDAMRAQIREARRVRGWSQLEFGKKAGLAQKHVSGIETGKIVPRFDTMLDLLRALDLDLVLVPRALTPIVAALVRDHRNRDSHRGGDAEGSLYAVDDDGYEDDEGDDDYIDGNDGKNGEVA